MSLKNFLTKNASPKLILQVRKKGTCKNLQVDIKKKNEIRTLAFADDKVRVAEKLKFLHGRVENILEKGKNAG